MIKQFLATTENSFWSV